MYTNVIEINLDKSCEWEKTFFKNYSPDHCFIVSYKDIDIKVYATGDKDTNNAVLHGHVNLRENDRPNRPVYLPMTCVYFR